MKSISGSTNDILAQKPYGRRNKICSTDLIIFGLLLFVLIAQFALVGCVKNKADLGSEKNPIKIHFLPSVDAKVLAENADTLKNFLEKKTPYKYEITIPQSYIAVVEAFGTKRADVAAINTYGYYLAHKKYGAEARLTVIRHGSTTYQSQYITRTDSNIKTIEDLAGKKLAFVDPASASGYLLPMKTLRDKKISPKDSVFAMKHDNVVTMVYQGQVDAGATYYTPPSKNEKGEEQIEDARRLVLTQFPDVEKKVRIISLSDSIPNDPIIFRKDMSDKIKTEITAAFAEFVATPEGRESFLKMYSVTGMKAATDNDYESVRKIFAGMEAEANSKVDTASQKTSTK